MLMQNILGQGCDINKDAVVLKSGERLGAAEIGLLATAGVMIVKVLLRELRAMFISGVSVWIRGFIFVSVSCLLWLIPSQPCYIISLLGLRGI